MKFVALCANGTTFEELMNEKDIRADCAGMITCESNGVAMERAAKAGVMGISMPKGKDETHEAYDDAVGETIRWLLRDTKHGFVGCLGWRYYFRENYFKQKRHPTINGHPALLKKESGGDPSFGGKGMYGINVHRAVFNARKNISGVTYHLVTKVVDGGETLDEEICDISGCKSPEEIETAVKMAEPRGYIRLFRNIQSGKVSLNWL